MNDSLDTIDSYPTRKPNILFKLLHSPLPKLKPKPSANGDGTEQYYQNQGGYGQPPPMQQGYGGPPMQPGYGGPPPMQQGGYYPPQPQQAYQQPGRESSLSTDDGTSADGVVADIVL